MKVRSGFVSNSSSSSFIVAVEDETRVKVKISFEADLEKYARRKLSTIEELNEYYDDYWGDRGWKYEECRKAIEAGKVVLVGSFDDQSGDELERFLCDNGLQGIVTDDVEIIQSEGGY
ncbi:MAG: hypothetical protein ACXAC5_05270 [Promethearchaeota archaeon]|jgi:hypothetical protein